MSKDFGKFIAEKVANDPPLAREVEMERRKMNAATYWMDRPTQSTRHMAQLERGDGISQMLDDLEALARNDGCIAAAWALEVLLETAERVPCK